MKFIMDGLMAHGMRKDMPCGVIEQGTRPQQRKVIADIASITERCREAAIKSPAVIVVGEVCKLSNRFDWFEKLPLKGKNIVVTRPKERQGVLTEKLKKLGAHVIACPCIETQSMVTDTMLDQLLEKIKTSSWIVFTSPAGVTAVMDAFQKRRIDGRYLAGTKIAVIGEATGVTLETYGIYPDLMPETYNGKKLGEKLAETVADGENVLLLRALESAPELCRELENAKICYEEFPVYETKFQVEGQQGELIKEKLQNDDIAFVTFTSSSTVEAFVQSIQCDHDRFVAACIGEKTRLTAEKYGMHTIESKKATIDELVAVIVEKGGADCNV